MNGCAWENETERADFYMEEYLASKNKIERIERERDRFKARVEALMSDLERAKPCFCCKREFADDCLLEESMDACSDYAEGGKWEWRGPQEGAADVECSAKPEASKENTHDFYGIIMDNVVDHIQQCYTKETVTLSDGTRAVIRRWKLFPDMTKEGENG